MKIKIYANYGVLAHEKQTIYTYPCTHGHAKYSELITVEIPAELNPTQDNDGEIYLDPDDGRAPWNPYPLHFDNDTLWSYDDKPVIIYTNKNDRGRRVTLPIID